MGALAVALALSGRCQAADSLAVDVSAAFSIQDVVSTRANFGRRIASRYLAIDVVVNNPTEKKIQLDKSALWFEVDYETVGSRKEPPQILAFGKDHRMAQFGEAFPSVLGTFDSIAGGHQQVFQLLDFGVAVLVGLSSGGVLNSARAKGSVALLTGLVLPRVQSIYWNPELEKAKRTNLVLQGADRFLQVPPHSSVQAKVFLPGTAILGLARTPVRVAQVRQIHLETEVVGEVR
jgi:hypothetical protein